MSPAAAAFTADYFSANYRHYTRQNPDRKLRFYRELIAQHAALGAGSRLLDLGCAFGRFLGSLDTACSRFGIDISEFAIREAARSVPGARFAVASAGAPPLGGRFDAIAAFDVIEHVPDLEEVARFVRGALADGGVFVFVVPVYDGPLGPVVRTLDRDPTHIHKQSRRFWLNWAEHHFRVVSWTGIFRYLLPHGPYIHWPAPALRRFAPAVAVTARRKPS